MTKDTRTLQAGAILQNGKYRILSVIGQGGFGITYQAVQTGLGMRVAIKEFFMKGSCQRDPSSSKVNVPVSDNEELVHRCLRKFKSEARKIASLNNDHIVNIIDIFDENGTSYYVMKYLGGGSLASVIKNIGALSEKGALKIIGEVSDALRSVHSNGLLHLDIKPANILLDERNRAVLIDFGVSKYVDSPADSSATSSLVGFSRGFAPLEQVHSTLSSLSPATDIYSLGATLFNLVTGTTPPEASDIMNEGLPELPANLSDEVKDAIAQAMKPRSKDRPQSIDEFMELLPHDEQAEPTSDDTVMIAPPEAEVITPAPASRWNSRIPLIISAAMLVSAIVLAAFTFSRSRSSEPQPTLTSSETSTSNEVSTQANTQVDSLSRSNSELQRQINDLTRQVNTLNTRNSTLQRENTNLRNEVNSYKPDAERWRRQLELNN